MTSEILAGSPEVNGGFYNPILTADQINQLGITGLSEILGEKPNFNVGREDILTLRKRVTEIEQARLHASIASIIESSMDIDNSDSNMSSDDQVVQSAYEKSDGEFTATDESSDTPINVTSVIESSEQSSLDSEADSDIENALSIEFITSEQIPQEVKDYFNEHIVKTALSYASEHGTLDGINGTSEEPSDAFLRIRSELSKLLADAVKDSKGKVDSERYYAIAKELQRLQNTVYVRIEAGLAESQKAKAIEQRDETSSDKTQEFDQNENSLSRDMQIASEMNEEFTQRVSEGKYEMTIEGLKSYIFDDIRDLLPRSALKQAMRATDLYVGSDYSRAVTKLLASALASKYADADTVEKRISLINRDLTVIAGEIKAELTEIDKATRFKRGLSRIRNVFTR